MPVPGLPTRDDALNELAALVAAVRDLPDDELVAASPCAGWRVGDVVAHVASVIDAQQAAFANMLAGSTERPPWENGVFGSATAARKALDEAQARAVETLGQVADEHMDRPVPLPFGTFPCANALDIILLEYGTHRWDVGDANGDLSAAAADVVLRLLPAFVAFYAVPPPPMAIAYRLEAPSVTIDVSGRDGGWVLEPGSPDATTVISGTDSAIGLFAVGRIGAGDRRLTITGADAGAFKAWFPGP